MDYQKIGKYIKDQRDKLGLSQQDLGDKVHVTRQAVSNWETGKTLPDSDILLSLSKVFDVTINDILCGESIEEVTLNLLDETNKKNQTIKRIIKVSTFIICVLLLSFFGLYFINNYNSIKVYKASSSSEHFNIIDGIIISTSKNTYFKLGHLEYKKNENIIVNKVKLYYKNNNKNYYIFESDVNDRLFVNNEGYDEIQKQKFSKYKDNLYLEVYFNDTEKEVLKIDLKEDFKNDYFIVLEESRIIKDLIKEDIPKLQSDFNKQELNTIIREEKPVIKYEPTKEPIKQPVQEEIEVQPPTPVQEQVSLEPEPVVDEPVIEEPIQAEEPVEQEEPININLEEISSLIETYGTKIMNTYRLNYTMDDGTIIKINKNKSSIIIEKQYLNERIRLSIRLSDNETVYQKNIDGLEVEKEIGLFEKIVSNNTEISLQIEDCFSLIYKEKQ